MAEKKGNQEAAIAAIVSGKSRKAAAEAAGISEATLYRRFDDVEFQKALQLAKDEILSEAITDMKHGCRVAVRTLVDVMEKGRRESDKIAAARTLLELAIKAAGGNQAEARVSMLIKKVEEFLKLD